MKLLLKKSVCTLVTVKFLEKEIDNITYEPISFIVNGIHKLQTPTSKIGFLRLTTSLNFNSIFITKLHISFKLFYTVLHDDIPFEWSPKLDKLLNEIKTSLTKKRTTRYPEYFLSFLQNRRRIPNWIKRYLFQTNTNRKVQIIFYSIRVLNTQQQSSQHTMENFVLLRLLFPPTNEFITI